MSFGNASEMALRLGAPKKPLTYAPIALGVTENEKMFGGDVLDAQIIAKNQRRSKIAKAAILDL